MLGSSTVISLVFRAINRTSNAFTHINGEFKKLDGVVKATSRRLEHLNNVGRRMAGVGAGMSIAGGGLAYTLGLTDAAKQAVDAEYNLRVLGNTGKLTAAKIAEIEKSLRRTSVETNQFVKDLIPGLQVLVGKNLDPTVATRFMPVLGKVATAQAAEVVDLAETAYAVFGNLNVKDAKAMAQAMEIAARAGELGGFELKDMAKSFPMLTGGAQRLRMAGVGAVAQIGAALQIAMKTAGDPDIAANNFRNFLTKITSRETVASFAKFGVSVKRELNAAIATGADPIEHMIGVIRRITGGDPIKLSELFADMQVTDFLVPMMENMEEYRRIRDESAKSKGLIDANFINMMKTTREQARRLRINMADLIMPTLNDFLVRINGGLRLLNGNSTALKIVLGGVASLLGGGMLLSGFGFMFMGISKGVVAIKELGAYSKIAGKGLVALLGLVRNGIIWTQLYTERLHLASIASKVWAVTTGLMTSAMKGARWALAVFNGTLLACPIFWIIGAIIALGTAAFFVVKYWKPISAFFANLWKSIKAVFSGGISWVTQAGKNTVIGLWRGMMSVINRPVEAMKALVQKMRNLLPFSPAKEGPFRDLHRVRIVETLAAGVKPGPLVGAMRETLSMTKAAMVPANAGSRRTAAAFAAGRPGAGRTGGQSIVINSYYSPTVTISGEAAKAKDDFAAMLRQHKDEILRLIETARLRGMRTAY